MTDEPLECLSSLDSSRVWDEFDAGFDFRPSMHDFPAIDEPADSITWSLKTLGDRPAEPTIDHLVALICRGLTECTPRGSSLLLLDWHHNNYRLRPDLPPTDMFLPEPLTKHLPPGWPRRPLPDGDYPAVLAEGFRYGSFGHPWERTLCLFGTDLLAAIADEVTEALPVIIRRSGQPCPPT